jgi:hypothetical protein
MDMGIASQPILQTEWLLKLSVLWGQDKLFNKTPEISLVIF